jgi:hypothetical protein
MLTTWQVESCKDKVAQRHATNEDAPRLFDVDVELGFLANFALYGMLQGLQAQGQRQTKGHVQFEPIGRPAST